MKRSDYLSMLAQLPVNKKGSKVAPHKAILLLSICDLIEDGKITGPFIPLDGNLSRAFDARWEMHVPNTSRYSCRLSYPFYHLSTSGFWHLEKADSYTEKREYSTLASLKRSFTGATIDEELFELIKNPKTRDIVKRILISFYLSEGQNNMNFTALRILPLLALICCGA